MSSINTNGIDVNYPVPGQNNSSQGFRNNFAAIKTNLDTAGEEISDLQNKVVVKSALNNTSINNDMANTLISNASTRSFRATTYNLGNALSGTVLIDVSLGDVQYGTVAGDVALQFGSWAPYGTQSNVQLQLAISNAEAKISFPTEVVYSNNDFGLTTVENYGGDAGEGNFTIPYGVSQVNYTLSSVDCGNTIAISPINRPRQTTQIQQRDPSPTGFQGDVIGTTCVSSGATQFTITGANTDPYLTTSGNTTTLGLFTDMPIVFTGTSLESNIVVGTTYYVKDILSTTTFTVSSTIGGANIAVAANVTGTTMFANPVQYMYVATQDYNSTEYTKTVSTTTASTDRITLDNTTNFLVNAPIIFTGNTDFANTKIIEGEVYYIKSIPTSTTITIARSRTNGIAGSTVQLGDKSGLSFSATAYIGADIWKRVSLTNW